MGELDTDLIFHIVREDEWLALDSGDYRPPSLTKVGFIHCSARHQVVRVANSLFHGREDLLLLAIDARSCADVVRWEDLYEVGEDFPHLYGPLPLNAVVMVERLNWQRDGTFRLPAGM